MANSIKNLLKEACEDFIYNLKLLRKEINNDDTLSTLLLETHFLYTKIINNIDIYNKSKKIETIKFNLVSDQNELKIFAYENKDNSFEVVFHDKFGVLSVSTKFDELNQEAMKFLKDIHVDSQIEQISLFLSLYLEYKWRVCDYCLEYCTSPFFYTPLGRTLETDYISAYHKECKNK